ncbi:putative secreted protein [Paenibacillus aceris]|uniref:Secreted protein n=1 Tax=Paenibacillus aceris TaxID=869555 RepID=A0ABS4HQD5_9BACL|nr:putative secreted protein [Paenibacillus aceris]
MFVAPLIHSIFSVIFISILVKGTFISGVITTVFITLVVTLITTFAANGKWYVLFTNVLFFFIFFVLLNIILNLGNQRASDDDNNGVGILILGVGIPAILFSLLIGTIIGIVCSILLHGQVQTIKKKIYRSLN